MAPVRGGYYDGRSSKRHAVTLEIAGDALRVRGAGVDLAVPLAEVRPEERVANAPRLLQLPGGALVECDDPDGADALLARAGRRDSAVVRLQRSWRAALAAVAGVAAAAAVFYVWGLPWAADRIAAAVPAAWSEALGREVISSLNPPLFRPSRLEAKDRAAIEQTLAAALRKAGKPAPRLEYRSFAGGPNAFALPGNVVVLTDEMVKLAAKTKDPQAALLGVLGHEVGHLTRQHPMRQFVRATVLSAVLAWWIGDFSAVLATAAPVMLAARYSRDFEREADREAAELLRLDGRPAEPLVELFELLEGRRAGRQEAQEGLSDYFSSHPGMQERIRILRGQNP